MKGQPQQRLLPGALQPITARSISRPQQRVRTAVQSEERAAWALTITHRAAPPMASLGRARGSIARLNRAGEKASNGMALRYPRELLSEVLHGSLDDERPLAALLDVVFFASLSVVEGTIVRVAVVHHERGAAGLAEVRDSSPPEGYPEEPDPELAWDVTPLVPRPLDVGTLAKLSCGMEYGAQVVVIGGDEDHLRIEGIARRRKWTNGGDVVRIAAPRPGVLVFEMGFAEVLRFEAGERSTPALNVFGLDGPIRTAVGAIVGETGSGANFYTFTESALRDLIRRMRATGAGGIFALYAKEPDEALLSSMKLRRMSTAALAERIAEEKAKRLRAIWVPTEGRGADEVLTEHSARQRAADEARDRLDAAIEDVARMSAIDGAVIGGPGLAVYGAGIVLPSGEHGQVLRALDVEMNRTVPYPAHNRGARHRAAFHFAFTNPGAVAFVVSEDGPVSCVLRRDENVVLVQVHVPDT